LVGGRSTIAEKAYCALNIGKQDWQLIFTEEKMVKAPFTPALKMKA
jgi:hypothetical protein